MKAIIGKVGLKHQGDLPMQPYTSLLTRRIPTPHPAISPRLQALLPGIIIPFNNSSTDIINNFLEAIKDNENLVSLAEYLYSETGHYFVFTLVLSQIDVRDITFLYSSIDHLAIINYCFRNLTMNLDPSLRQSLAEHLFDTLTPSQIDNTKQSEEYCPSFISFCIFKSLYNDRSRELLYFKNRMIFYNICSFLMSWCEKETQLIHMSHQIFSICPNHSRGLLSHEICQIRPADFHYFLCQFDRNLVNYHFLHQSHSTALSLMKSTPQSYASYKHFLNGINRNGTGDDLLQKTNMMFKSEYIGVRTFNLYEVSLLFDYNDETLFETVHLYFGESFATIPPLLIAIASQNERLGDWLIKICTFLTDDQIKALFFGLSYRKTVENSARLLTTLTGTQLQSFLLAIAPHLRTKILDTRSQELEKIQKQAQTKLDFLKSSTPNSTVDCETLLLEVHQEEASLHAILHHPTSMAYWRVSANFHPLASRKLDLKILWQEFEELGRRLRVQNPAPVVLNLKESAPPFLNEDLLHKMGLQRIYELEEIGLRTPTDLSHFGLTEGQVNLYLEKEALILDDVPIFKKCEWDKVKWTSHESVVSFLEQHQIVCPEDFVNPFLPLIRYANQQSLKSHWKELNKRNLYTVDSLIEGCLIQNSEELEVLKELVVKLNPMKRS